MESRICSSWYVQLIAGVLALVLMTFPKPVCGDDLEPFQKDLLEAGKAILEAEATKKSTEFRVPEDKAALDALDIAIRNLEEKEQTGAGYIKLKAAKKAKAAAQKKVDDRIRTAELNKTRKSAMATYQKALKKRREAEKNWKKAWKVGKNALNETWFDTWYTNTNPDLEGKSPKSITTDFISPKPKSKPKPKPARSPLLGNSGASANPQVCEVVSIANPSSTTITYRANWLDGRGVIHSEIIRLPPGLTHTHWAPAGHVFQMHFDADWTSGLAVQSINLPTNQGTSPAAAFPYSFALSGNTLGVVRLQSVRVQSGNPRRNRLARAAVAALVRQLLRPHSDR